MLVFFAVMAARLALATALPFLPLAHGVMRVGDFPRQQFLALALLLLGLSLPLAEDTPWRIVQLALAAVALVQAVHVVRFTPLWRKQSADYDPARDGGEPLRLLACNVKMSNRRFDALAGLIARHDPDIVVLMEVDAKWADALRDVLGRYPNLVSQPQGNAYGMLLASRFALSGTAVRCLLTDGVPSIVTKVAMPRGLHFRLYSIHPEPPVPHRGAEGRDGETALVALKAREDATPVLVTGDLNDVAWSRTTERFRRVSRLLDPRIGRKVFSTFDARTPLLRWPLDHLFHSPEFRLKEMRRLPPCGSDHFPVLFDLVLTGTPKAEAEPAQAGEAELARARDLVDQARKRDETPIGTDWEG